MRNVNLLKTIAEKVSKVGNFAFSDCVVIEGGIFNSVILNFLRTFQKKAKKVGIFLLSNCVDNIGVFYLYPLFHEKESLQDNGSAV